MTDPREIELKLDVDEADLADLKRRVLPNLGIGDACEHLVSVYYDTPDHVLRAHGFALRLRRSGRRVVQTLKVAKSASAGLFDRSEWETEVDGDEPDLAALPKTLVRRLLAKAKGPIEPVFEARVARSVWRVETGRSRVELALDEGRVIAAGRAESVAELELELKSGRAADLFDLLGELNDVASLRIGVLTKSERGYRLLAGGAQPVKAARIALDHGTSTAEAFQAIMRACLHQFRLNESLVTGARAPEALHQARVALRRLRSALSLFRPVIADGQLERLKDGLRALSRVFGDARNLDVYLARSAEPETQGHPDESGVATYLAEVQERRTAAYDRLIEQLQSRDIRRLMLDLFAWIENGAWLTDEDPARQAARVEPIGRFAAAILEACRHKVKRKGRRLEALSPNDRHRVRIQAKKLRYAAEFFAGLPGRRRERARHRAFINAMEDLQRQLGELNDIQTSHDLAVDLAISHGSASPQLADAAFAAGHVSGAAEAEIETLLHAARASHRSFVRTNPFWRRWPG